MSSSTTTDPFAADIAALRDELADLDAARIVAAAQRDNALLASESTYQRAAHRLAFINVQIADVRAELSRYHVAS